MPGKVSIPPRSFEALYGAVIASTTHSKAGLECLSVVAVGGVMDGVRPWLPGGGIHHRLQSDRRSCTRDGILLKQWQMRKTHKHRKPALLRVSYNTLNELCVNCEGLCYRFAKTTDYMLPHVDLHAFTPETFTWLTCSIVNIHAFTPKTSVLTTCSTVV